MKTFCVKTWRQESDSKKVKKIYMLSCQKEKGNKCIWNPFRSSPPEVKVFWKMQQIYRKTPLPKCDFNKVAKQNLNVNLLYIFRTPFYKNTCFCLLIKTTSKNDFCILIRFHSYRRSRHKTKQKCAHKKNTTTQYTILQQLSQ